MFSSPARPTPRRGLRMRESLSVSRSAMDNASVATRSRLGSVRQLSPASSAGESTRTVRHQDGDEVYWSRDERHSVISNGPLPSEVHHVLNDPEFDFIQEAATAQVDSGSGFALVSTPTSCFAWNYAKKTHSSPTVYTFPAPIPSRSHVPHLPPPLAAFYGARAAEPGLVLVSATGEVRLWESMSLALANVNRFQPLELSLAADDFAERIWRLDDANFVITTTRSAAFHLSIVNHGGRLVPTAQPFTRPGGLFNRASPIIFDSLERNGIVAVTPVQGGVCLLGRSTLQAWQLLPDGALKLMHEFNLHDAIGSSLLDDDSVWQSGNLRVDLNDLVATGPGQFATLVSYTRHSGTSDYSRMHNNHAVVLFDFNASTNTVTIDKIVHVSYLAHPDPRMPDVPRLYVPNGTQMAFVHFADAVVMVSLSNAPYEDTVRLGDSKNLFLGAGPARGASLTAMARVGGIMTIDVYAGSAQAPKLSSSASATAGLKTKIEQTVFFGDRNDNPLTFDLPPGFKGDLAEAAEAVSSEIVSSSSPYLPYIFEVRPQLTDRRSRLGALMKFIHANGVLSLIPQDSRRRLESHAEKIKAAIDLWDYQNRLMDKLNTRSPQSLLSDSIQLLMNQLGAGAGEEDVVRLFFKTQVLRLDRLLEIVFASFQAAVQSAGQGADLSEWILEANRIFITVLRSATQVREADTTVYQVDRERPSVELWTAADAIIDDLDALYSATQRLIKDRTRQLGSVVDEHAAQNTDTKLSRQQRDQATLKMQMAQLAAALCENMEDKLRTNAVLQLNGAADASEGLALAKRWDDLKPRIIRPLVDIDRVREAYALAEHHRDFPTLVYLTHNAVSSQGPARIEEYIEKYGPDFAFVLYQWYIDQGQLYDLLSQDEVYGGLLTAFFERHPHPELSWIHDVAIRDYGEAATALHAVESDTAALAQKHLMASIGKLAAVADAKARGQTALIEEIDDSLDLINTETALAAHIREVAPGSGHPKKANGKKYVAGLELGLPAFEQLLEQQVGSLLEGDALDVEALVDVLTLTMGREDDAATALERLAHDASLPEGRKQVALISTWRRVYIHDDWANITKTTGRSEEAQRNLQRETATYRTLRALRELPTPLSSNFTSLSPKIAAQPPLMVEIKARFPELPGHAHEQLMEDHEAEIRRLEAGVAAGLEKGVKAITELVDADLKHDADGDVSM